jgi:hypothetical protein
VPSKIPSKTSVLVLLILGASVHALCSDLHSPEDPAELIRVFGARRLSGTAALMRKAVLTAVNVRENAGSRVKRFRTGMKTRNTTNYKCLCVPRVLHL